MMNLATWGVLLFLFSAVAAPALAYTTSPFVAGWTVILAAIAAVTAVLLS